ncbi:hemolysin family protein [Longispora sp. NPDC051575]|uniref:hemolysin family protein n=1 Tax=Longispora sp. NPDC051575 TaxID=3154943 RepID=UPI0034270E05
MLILSGVAVIVVLTVATGWFVAQEFAFIAVDRNRLRQLASTGDAAAERALRVTGRLSFMLSGAQLGITVTALLAGYVAEPLLGEGLAAVLGTAGVPKAASLSIAFAAALVFATVVQMVLGELAPKNWAIAKPETLAKALSRSTLIYLAVAGPLIRLFDVAATRLLRRLRVEPVEELPQGATAEDFGHLIADAHDGGHLDADTYRLLDRGLDFRALTAGDVMVARPVVTTIAATAPASRVIELLDTGHSRFPVTGASVDDILGVVGLAEVLAVPVADRASTPVGRIAGRAVVVPESLRVPRVLERLRTAHRQLAVVVDEYGGFAGVVSLEDIAEELVGEILDEDDHAEPTAVRQEDGSWLLPGRFRLDEAEDATGLGLPDDEAYETLSGFVLARLGHVPSVGEEITVRLHGPSDVDTGEPGPVTVVLLTVVSVTRHVPDTVALRVVDGER